MTSRAVCAVNGCHNQKNMKEVSFFKLPVDPKRRTEWLQIIGRPDMLKRADLKPECHFVCSVHFDESMMISKPILRPNAIPTKYIPTLPVIGEEPKFQTTFISKSTQTKRILLKNLLKGKDIKKIKRIDLNKIDGTKDSFLVKDTKKKLRAKLKTSEERREQLESEMKELKQELDAVKALISIQETNIITVKKQPVDDVDNPLVITPTIVEQ